MDFCSLPCGKHMTSGTSFQFAHSLLQFSLRTLTYNRHMEYARPPPVTEEQLCSVASEMTGNVADLDHFVEQEESSFMESPKGRSTEWTNEKHSLYLKSMEASFVDQLYISLDMQNCENENECSSDIMSSQKNHANNHRSSDQFKVRQHGFWSRVDFRREKLVHNEATRPNISSSNPWILHFKNRNKQGSTKSLENPPLTSCSNTEVMDQNFVEDSGVQMMNMTCRKKRKNNYADPQSSN